MNYTKEELLKRGFTTPIRCRYFSYTNNTWVNQGLFSAKYSPKTFDVISNEECLVVESPSKRTYTCFKFAIPVSELERLGVLKKEELVKITSLEQDYVVICNNYEENKEVYNFITKGSPLIGAYKYVINSIQVTSKLWDWIPSHLESLPILTFSEWKQLKDKEMNKDNKKIIGYKAPYDLFGKQIGKGVLYIKNNQADCIYFPKGNSLNHIFSMPKEIVETWEPVYESIELPVICNRKGVFDREELTVTYGEFKFSVSYLSELKNLFTSDTAMIESWIFNHTSSFRITKKELEEIFKYLDAQ